MCCSSSVLIKFSHQFDSSTESQELNCCNPDLISSTLGHLLYSGCNIDGDPFGATLRVRIISPVSFGSHSFRLNLDQFAVTHFDMLCIFALAFLKSEGMVTGMVTGMIF
jgi:hypothetical protein